MSLRSLLFVPGLVLAFSLVGCGGGVPIEDLVAVEGKLLVDGKPLEGVEVTFIPLEGKNSRGGSGMTDDSGAFEITDLDQSKLGLAAGTYVVAYSRRRLPDGSAAPEPEDGATRDPGVILVETFPSHLTSSDPKVLTNQVVIPDDGDINLELKTSLKKAARRGGI